MRVYIVCNLQENTGFITNVEPYITLETAIHRAVVILKEETENDSNYISNFVDSSKEYLKNGLTFEDECGFVRIIVKDAI